MEAIDHIAKKHGLPLLYDRGARVRRNDPRTRRASYGEASMFSFHATKCYHAIDGLRSPAGARTLPSGSRL
jgi:dTDP-4-amino-4,6-dideoxygalactose transaminase